MCYFVNLSLACICVTFRRQKRREAALQAFYVPAVLIEEKKKRGSVQ
jgi:hypothetical protein